MKKIHFNNSDSHNQPACKVYSDTTKIESTNVRDDVTCLGCLNQLWRRDNPHEEARRIVKSYT